MIMAADPNMNRCVFPPSFYGQQVVSFQSGPASGGGLGFGGDGGGGLCGGASSAMIPMLGTYGSALMEPLPGLKHDTGLAVDWSFDEQAILNDGLNKFADEPGMSKYIKIAALLPDKTVRDVALRCRWMAKRESVKRRKIEESYGRKISNRKEKVADSSMIVSVQPIQTDNMTAYHSMFQPVNHMNHVSYEAPVVDSATQRLLEENIQVLNQISMNLSTYKLHDNIELLSRTGNNITTILNSMSQTPGIISRMPPLPVSMNDDLLGSIVPVTSQATLYGATSCINMKHETR